MLGIFVSKSSGGSSKLGAKSLFSLFNSIITGSCKVAIFERILSTYSCVIGSKAYPSNTFKGVSNKIS